MVKVDQTRRRGGGFQARRPVAGSSLSSASFQPKVFISSGPGLRLAPRSRPAGSKTTNRDDAAGNGDVWRSIFSVACFDQSLAILGTRLTTVIQHPNSFAHPSSRRTDDDEGEVGDAAKDAEGGLAVADRTYFYILGFTRDRYEYGKQVIAELHKRLCRHQHLTSLKTAAAGPAPPSIARNMMLVEQLEEALRQVVPWRDAHAMTWKSPLQLDHAASTLDSLWEIRCAYVDARRIQLCTTTHFHNLHQINITSAVAKILFSEGQRQSGTEKNASPGVVLASAPRSYVPDGVLISFGALFDSSLLLGSDWIIAQSEVPAGGASAASSHQQHYHLHCAKKFHLGSLELVSIEHDRERLLQRVVELGSAADGLPNFMTFLRKIDAITAGPISTFKQHDVQKQTSSIQHCKEDALSSSPDHLSSAPPACLYPTGLQLRPDLFSLDVVRRAPSQDYKALQSEICGLFAAHAAHVFFIGEGYQVARELSAYSTFRRCGGRSTTTDESFSPPSIIFNHLHNLKSGQARSTTGEPKSSSIDLVWLSRHPLGVARLFVIVVVVVAQPASAAASPLRDSQPSESSTKSAIDGCDDHTILAVLEMRSDDV